MAFQPKIDLRGYDKKVRDLALIVPSEAKNAIIAEGQRLVEDLIKRCKPKNKSKMTKKIWGNVLSTALLPREAADVGAAQAKADRARAKDYVRIDRFYNAWHQRKRIPLAEKNRVLRARATAFVKNQLAHRGYLASGWLGGGNPLKATKGLTKEITGHKSQGTFQKIDTLTRFRITITNLVSYAQKNPVMQRILRASIEGRKKQIMKNIEAIKKGRKFQILRRK